MKKNDRPAALRLWQVRAVLAENEICASVDTRKGSNSHNQVLPTPKQKQQLWHRTIYRWTNLSKGTYVVKAGLGYYLNVRSQGEIRIKCNPENLDSVRKLYGRIRYFDRSKRRHGF